MKFAARQIISWVWTLTWIAVLIWSYVKWGQLPVTLKVSVVALLVFTTPAIDVLFLRKSDGLFKRGTKEL